MSVFDPEPGGRAPAYCRTSVNHAHRVGNAVKHDGFDAVIANVKIQVAISVKVGQRQRSGAAFRAQTGCDGHIGKLPVPEILEVGIRPRERIDKQIQLAIAIHVGQSYAARGWIVPGNSGASGYILKLPPPQIPIERVRSFSVAKVQITPAIAIEISRGNAGPVE